jgi:hypothetical protein
VKAVPYLACALLGAILDFLVYGVGEIVWPVIYLPLFFACASILYTRLLRSRWEKQRRWAIGTFLAGIVVARLTCVNHHQEETYPMNAEVNATITLRTPGSPRTLLVSSDKLVARLAGKPAAQLPVVVEVTTDYACISNFQVSTIDGIDVLLDPNASWTWRTETGAAFPLGPGQEDQKYPWCRFRWYRKS